MARIPIIDYESSDGELREIYDDLIKSRGKLANVHRIHSLSPDSLRSHMDFYMTVMFSKSPLKRYQREMMAVVVSRANNCGYCQDHHAAALSFYWKDDKRVELFRRDYQKIDLSTEDNALCAYADLLTRDPGSDQMDNVVFGLKHLGFSDRAVLDATLVIGYFNFVNRLVLGLDVEPESNTGGYKY